MSRKQIYLNPGELIFCKEPTAIRTVLGSCVGFCVFDRVNGWGGMSHFVLPQGDNVGESQQNRYAEYAIPALLRAFKAAGSKKEDLVVKLLGGSDVNMGLRPENRVGSANVRVSHDWIQKLGLELAGEEVGGDSGRQVEFYSDTGDIKFRRIQNPDLENVKVSTSISGKIKVMIIDDAKTNRMLIKRILESDSDIEVVAEAEDALQAIEIRKTVRPDVITLDINMPKMDGVTYLKSYMPIDPVPTIIISAYNSGDSAPVITALESGAFDFMGKPSVSDGGESADELKSKVRAAYLSKGHRGFARKADSGASKLLIQPGAHLKNALIAIGASTGGPEAIKEVLSKFPGNVPPILMVQHMPAFFTKAFADRLNQLVEFNVREAIDGEEIKEQTAYLAPGGKHLCVEQAGGRLMIRISNDPPVNRFKPSVDYLFKSLVKLKGFRTYAALLTGMGQDGADGLLQLKKMGYHTIAQDNETSAVYGMPRVAAEIGAAEKVLPIDQIADQIVNWLNASEKQNQQKAS